MPFAKATYLVDIIFAKAVCISIPGGPPELSVYPYRDPLSCPLEDKVRGQFTPIISWGRGSSGVFSGMDIQTALAKMMYTR